MISKEIKKGNAPMWTNWMAAFGVMIEFVGFATLAYELVQTNKLAVVDTTAIAREKEDFDRIELWDGEGNADGKHMVIVGGGLGKLIEGLRAQKEYLHSRTGLIMRGVIFSGAGTVLQVIAGFGQAMH
jgi:hypothetical protein